MTCMLLGLGMLVGAPAAKDPRMKSSPVVGEWTVEAKKMTLTLKRIKRKD